MEIPTIEDFRRMERQLNDLLAMVSNAMTYVKANQTVTVSDICKIEGVSKTQILGKEKYLLPNFGVSEYPCGVTRWKIETFIKWRAIPVSERYSMMKNHLENVRKAGVNEIKKNGASPRL